MRIFAWAVAALLLLSSHASADIRITEVMSSSGATVDWFELTNFGGSAVDITGWKMDDGSNSFAASVALNGVTSINPGESVVFIESAGGANVNSFKDFWFGAGNAPSGLKVGYYSGSGVSFSSSGDGVVVFDALGSTMAPLVTFAAATSGFSFDNFDGSLTINLPLSQVGVNGAFQSVGSPSNIGSPGAVPEPSALGLLAVAGVVAGGLRRKRS
jgi:hypothetical protein